jgi:putative hydrolase of the HAD superfamily
VANAHYDTVFLDVDKTLLWVDVDIEGYVEDLAPYSTNGPLTVERAVGPVWEGMQAHIQQNVNYPTADELEGLKRRNQRRTAQALDLDVPPEILSEVSESRIRFRPYPESEQVLSKLRELGYRLYVVSNWDVQLESVLEDLGWTHHFDGIVASAVVGVEKPDPGIFEEVLRISGANPDRVVHVGNDPVSDVKGATACGIDAVFVNRSGEEAPEAVAVMQDLSALPGWIGAAKNV